MFARNVAVAAEPRSMRNRKSRGRRTFLHLQRERALVEASRCLTRKIAEGPPSKKANKKRPLRARRTRFTTLTSSLAALGIAGPRASLYLFFSFIPSSFFTPPLLLLFTPSASAFVAFSRIRAAVNSRNPRAITSYGLIHSGCVCLSCL